MKLRSCLAVILVVGAASIAAAVDHRVEKADEGPPTDAVGAEIAGKLDPAGIKVVRGTSRIVCEVWLVKEIAGNAAAAPTGVQYPFQSGSLIGVIRYPREGSDFRDQDIAEGVYTLRYGLQPVDGAHVGTFPTRDFLLMSKVEVDQSAAPVDIKALTMQSASAAETNHPAILGLVRVEEKAESYPAITHNEEKDWWIVRLEAATKAGDKAGKTPVDLVVVGNAGE